MRAVVDDNEVWVWFVGFDCRVVVDRHFVFDIAFVDSREMERKAVF